MSIESKTFGQQDSSTEKKRQPNGIKALQRLLETDFTKTKLYAGRLPIADKNIYVTEKKGVVTRVSIYMKNVEDLQKLYDTNTVTAIHNMKLGHLQIVMPNGESPAAFRPGAKDDQSPKKKQWEEFRKNISCTVYSEELEWYKNANPT